ncbi:MAG: hypothetical protein AMXMBFR48_19430 [Ignavibacteriales bacterium]
MENYLRITILMKDRNISFKVKKFPVHIGSMKGPNVIPLTGDGISPKHGTLSVEKGKLYYEDSSETGTKINNRPVKREKSLLALGAIELQIGRYRVVLENNFAGKPGIVPKLFLDKRIMIPGATILLFALLFSAASMFKISPFGNEELDIENFYLTSVVINHCDTVRLSNIVFISNPQVDTAKISFSVIYVYGNKSDSLKLTHADFTEKGFLLPSWVQPRRPGELESELELRIRPSSEEYDFVKSEVVKPFTLSFRKEIQNREGVTMISEIKPQRAFEVSFITDADVANYEINFGEGPVLNGQVFKKAKTFYTTPGEKTVKAAVTLAGSRKVQFQRKFTIQ